MTTTANLLLQEYAQVHQLKIQEFDAEKSVSIEFEQDIDIHCQLNQEEDFITFYSYVSPMEEDMPKQALLLMLQANNFGTLTRGYTLSVSPNSNQVMLHNLMPVASLDQERFSFLISQLADATGEWRNFLQTPPEAADEPENNMFNLLRSV